MKDESQEELGDNDDNVEKKYIFDIVPTQFEIKTATSGGKETPKIDPKWVGLWKMVVFFKLMKKLPNQWVHLPAGSACKEVVPNELLTDVPVYYQQHE